MKIRNLKIEDYPFVLKLNNNNMPAVSELDIESLRKLVQQSLRSLIIEEASSGKIAGFCIILAPNSDYASENYKWICERYKQFEYLDRIVIAKNYQGLGYGKALYDRWQSDSLADSLLVEVNIKPMNKDSILFHEKMGFKAIGEQDTTGGKKRVQFMLRKK